MFIMNEFSPMGFVDEEVLGLFIGGEKDDIGNFY